MDEGNFFRTARSGAAEDASAAHLGVRGPQSRQRSKAGRAEAFAVVRTMPNRPALVGAGATGLFAPPSVSATDRARAEAVMRATGEVVWVKDESHIDAVTALSGSGPAYFFYLAELMAQAGVDLGLEPDVAKRLAVATLHGSGMLARMSDGDLARLRAEVTSKAARPKPR